jgi:hypothetical protein
MIVFGAALGAIGVIPLVHFLYVVRESGHFISPEIPLVTLAVIGFEWSLPRSAVDITSASKPTEAWIRSFAEAIHRARGRRFQVVNPPF